MTDFLPITDSGVMREQVERITSSDAFRRRKKLVHLFEYLVAETREGRADDLTQKKIAAEVFGIKGSFDPSSDGTVRIATGRLRNALQEYYRKEAEPDEVRIFMPQRHYCIAAEPAKPVTTQIGSAPSPQGVSPQAPKRISQNDMVGELGITFIRTVCLGMGFMWYSTGLEAGIDGFIEIRFEDGEVTNNIIQVQCKATDRPFEAESETSFEFRCSPRDLDYWLRGNAPVILVRCRPKTNEAYWVSVKDYFRDPAIRKSGKIIFDKVRNKFDSDAKAALQRLAAPDSGLYLGTRPKNEVLYSNLLVLASYPRHYYVAETQYRTVAEVFATLKDFTRAVHGEWILGGRMFTSFHDLSTRPWSDVCERGTVERLNTKDWALSDDPVRQRQFVQLLNACLRDKLFRKGIKFSRENQCYYFRAPQDLSNREYGYQSREHRTSRWVFKGYAKKSDHTQMSYYRHSAFEGKFVRYGETWYLQITPTYHFTRDGERTSKYAADLMAGIKRLETNQAVHGQVVMWAHVLTERSLFDIESQFIDFGSLIAFELDVGIDDDEWLKDEDHERPDLQERSEESRSQGLLL